MQRFKWRLPSVVAGLLLLTCGRAAFAAEPDASTEKVPQQASSLGEFRKQAPTGIDDLRKIEARVQQLVESLTACTVAVRVGQVQGSGVIVSKDGLVLTAAHVAGPPRQNVSFILPDGGELKGRTLGSNRLLDAGMMKIETDRELPFVNLGNTKDVKLGDWCIGTGHPGGFQKGRSPVVRLGRIVRITENLVQSDCTLVGGDSGGPVFDLNGNIIGIHSRIGPSLQWNLHVPVAAYRAGWDQMLASQTWGRTPPKGGPFLGVLGDDHEKGALITSVPEGNPAQQAGVRPNDVIVGVDGNTFKGFSGLAGLLSTHKPGDEVKLTILRGEETIELTVSLAARP